MKYIMSCYQEIHDNDAVKL